MVKALLAAMLMWFGPGTHIVTHAPWKVRPTQQVVVVEKDTATPYGTIREDETLLAWRTQFWQGCADPFRFHGTRYCWMADVWGHGLRFPSA